MSKCQHAAQLYLCYSLFYMNVYVVAVKACVLCSLQTALTFVVVFSIILAVGILERKPNSTQLSLFETNSKDEVIRK